MENERKKKEAEDRLNLDKLKVMSNRQVADEKLEQRKIQAVQPGKGEQ